MMRIAAVILSVVCAVGCATAPAKTVVLSYCDFGPQVAAYETIGMEWWQWDNHGDPDPDYQYDIKVVVYRDIPLNQVQEEYPVLIEEKKDYRYLPYAKAMEYLNNTIEDNVTLEVTERLKKTRLEIEKKLGKPIK